MGSMPARGCRPGFGTGASIPGGWDEDAYDCVMRDRAHALRAAFHVRGIRASGNAGYETTARRAAQSGAESSRESVPADYDTASHGERTCSGGASDTSGSGFSALIVDCAEGE